MAFSVDIHDEATGAIKALAGALAERELQPAIGAAEVNLFQDHLLNNPDNKQGWPSTHFWARAARATHWSLVSEGVLVSVDQLGMRQRVFGGEIEPVNAKFLTIPARAEAYGKRAGEFNNLEIAWSRRGGKSTPFALVESAFQEVSFGKKKKGGTQTVTKGAEHGGAVMFWLVKNVSQAGDPGVIPSDQEITQTALETVSDAFDRAMARKIEPTNPTNQHE